MSSERFEDREEAEEPRESLVKMDTRPYRRFSRWLDRELEKLVQQWLHAAAPAAARPHRRSGLPTQPR